MSRYTESYQSTNVRTGEITVHKMPSNMRLVKKYKPCRRHGCGAWTRIYGGFCWMCIDTDMAIPIDMDTRERRQPILHLL